MNLMNKRLVSHFYRRSPDSEGWIQTMYITREDFSEVHYYAQSNDVVNPDKLNDDYETGSLIRLHVQSYISTEETVWVASDQRIYIASSSNPFDHKERQIYHDNILSIYDYIEDQIDKKIEIDDAVIDQLEQFFSENTWKILIAVLIKKIMNGQIDEEKFCTVSYVFSRLEVMYLHEFTKLLNEFDVAVSEGSFQFFYHNIKQKWDLGYDKSQIMKFFVMTENEQIPSFQI